MVKQQLRTCSAYVIATNVNLYNENTGEIVQGRGYYLQSYNSIVAAIIDNTLYTLPRFAYSATTWQHLRKFCQDYLGYYNGADWVRSCEHMTHYINCFGETRAY